jgi:HK97 family phage major capsid protein
MTTMHDLLEERAKTVAAMRQLADAPKGTGGDLSEEQAEQFDSLKGDLESFEKRIQRQALLDAAERRMQGETIAGTGDNRLDAQIGRFRLTRAIGGRLDADVDDALEREVGQELARRSGRSYEGIPVPLAALVETRVLTTGGDASNVIETDVMANEFIDALRPATVVGALGARFLTGLRGDIALPRMDALTPAAAWVAENAALTAADHSFDQVTGTPKHLGLLTEFSRKVFLQSDPSIEQVVRNDFQRKLAAGVDLAALNGSGSGAQPTGILQTTGIGSVSGASAAPDWDDIVNTTRAVDVANAGGGSMGWTMNGYFVAKLRRILKVSADAGAGFLMNDDGRVAGFNVAPTSQMPGAPTDSPPVDGTALFGNWSDLIVAFWGDQAADILVNPFETTAYSKGNIQIRAFVDADILVRHAAAFAEYDAVDLA